MNPSTRRALAACAAFLFVSWPAQTIGATMDAELRSELVETLAPTLDAPGPERFSFVVRGGLSLGVYESGVSWALLRLMKDLHDDESSSYRPELVAAAGASAGAINGFLAGLFWCSEARRDGTPLDTLDDNVLRNTWHAADIDVMIRHGDADLQEDKAAFSRQLLRDIQADVKVEIDGRRFREGCEVAFGLSLTRSAPVRTDTASVEVEQQRLVVPLTLSVPRHNGGKPRYYNRRMPPPVFDAPSGDDLRNRPFRASVVYLDNDARQPVLDTPLGINEIFTAVKASSSFPGAFAPMKLSYCIRSPAALRGRLDRAAQDERCPDDYRRLTSYFVDGGVFDNDPLELVRQLSEAGNDSAAPQYIKIDPGVRRAPVGFNRFELPEYGDPGDSMAIALSAGNRSRDGSKPDPGSAGTREILVRHCSYDDGRWQQRDIYRSVLVETAANSQFFIGTLHTRSDTGPTSVQRQAGEIGVAGGDRLLFLTLDEQEQDERHLPENRKLECPSYSVDDNADILRRRTIGIVDSDPAGVSTQLGFIRGSVASARGYRLYDELMRNAWFDGLYDDEPAEGERALLQPARLTPLTGDFLFSFGAFVDERFRDFDYYAGIYDAVFGVSEFVCLARQARNKAQCRAGVARNVYLHLCAPDATGDTTSRIAACRTAQPAANTTIHQLVRLEECGADAVVDSGADCSLGDWAWASQLTPPAPGRQERELALVGAALIEAEQAVRFSERDPFVRFVKVLAEHREQFLEACPRPRPPGCTDRRDTLFARMLEKADRHVASWYHPLSKRVIPRLLELEHEDKAIRDSIGVEPAALHGPIKVGLAVGGLALETVAEDPVGWQVDQTSVPQDDVDRRWLYALAPAEAAIDARNGDLGIFWNPGLRTARGIDVDFRIAPWLRQRFDDETIEFSEATAFLTYRNRSGLWSIGAGPTWTFTWNAPPDAERHNLGASVFAGLLGDKLRLTYGVRSFSDSDFAGDEHYLQLGVNDLPGLVYWGRQVR